ncbi:hypothetical protein [Paraburkholderia sp. D1E]|uniref:hypothetical protein n=1 Tax=Paraburkholderia sp. D1E TaxID=3461398 RepID=UPI00404634DE
MGGAQAAAFAFILWFDAVLQRGFMHGKTAPAFTRERIWTHLYQPAQVHLFHACILNVF